jgi:hypothetical protein
MKTMILAAAAALTLGTGVAFAAPNTTQSNERPAVVAQAPLTIRQTANVELAYVTTTQSVSEKEWNQNQGALG